MTDNAQELDELQQTFIDDFYKGDFESDYESLDIGEKQIIDRTIATIQAHTTKAQLEMLDRLEEQSDWVLKMFKVGRKMHEAVSLEAVEAERKRLKGDE